MTCFIAATQRVETVFSIGRWSDNGICGLLALVGLFGLDGERAKNKRAALVEHFV